MKNPNEADFEGIFFCLKLFTSHQIKGSAFRIHTQQVKKLKENNNYLPANRKYSDPRLITIHNQLDSYTSLQPILKSKFLTLNFFIDLYQTFPSQTTLAL